ncbi:hypothetical protein VOLCADRAFT_97066 [Volvox carteri f. nagariensis]|uniref:Uncharacterized protein n=1 Tax=Volvox carteri f. nagariensis TaxID=3068 RepID=D8UBT4_VOLCA|nr:uncharacterized protein VOLCADRAFT_97066 [Volvox carteri f. nagariensis]EFJ42822.1 hypothetical protein VOLCADRAFT_97066 [Volvox carteri f. nagariensis]|eukprot:XP_002956082.1 hypothetical protein VOLCADRAFT_97066 [Volvox carteri f. nagariensis]
MISSVSLLVLLASNVVAGQLSLHALHRTLAHLGNSAAAAFSGSGAFSPASWAAFLPIGLKQDKRLLALAPAAPAHVEQLLNVPQHPPPPVDTAGPNADGAADIADAWRDVPVDEASAPAAARSSSEHNTFRYNLEAVAPAAAEAPAEGPSAASGTWTTSSSGSQEPDEGAETSTPPPSGSDDLPNYNRGDSAVEDDIRSRDGDHDFSDGLDIRTEPVITQDDESAVAPAVEGAPGDVEPMPAEPIPAGMESYSPGLRAEDSRPQSELSSMVPEKEDYVPQAAYFRAVEEVAAMPIGTEGGGRWGGDDVGLLQAGAAAAEGTEHAFMTPGSNDVIQIGENTSVTDAAQAAPAPSPVKAEVLDARSAAEKATLHVISAGQSNELGLSPDCSLEQTDQRLAAQSPWQEDDLALVDLQGGQSVGQVLASGAGEPTLKVAVAEAANKPAPWQVALGSASLSLLYKLYDDDTVHGERRRFAADLLNSLARRSLAVQQQLAAPSHTVAAGVAVAAAAVLLVAFLQIILSARAARRQARDLRVALEGLETQVADARSDAKRQRDVRAATVRALAVSARERTAAAVQIAQQVSELQIAQTELTAALVSAVRDWQARGQMLTATLRRCRRRAERLAQMAAVERVTAQGELRLQMEAAERLAVSDRLRHAQELAELHQQIEKELDAERQRNSATAAAAQKRCAQYAAALRDQRRRNGRNLAAWLALRSWLGLQVEALSERATKLAAEHSAALEEANSVVERHRMRVAIVKQQLADQVAVVVETNRTNDELVQLLGEKDSVILELESELAATTAALESQRQQRDDVQQALTSTEESLSSSQREASALRAQLQDARAAVKDAEARAEQLADANAMLEQQISQFVKTVNLLAEMEEVNLAPIRAQAAALERQLVADREAAAAVVADRDAKLAAAAAELAEARREAEAAQRARGEAAKRLEECERELQTLQLELSRIEEEGPDSAVGFSSKQPSLRDQHHGDHRDRDQEAVLQQLLGPLAGLTPLPLPPDSRTLFAVASPASASAAAGGSLMSVADRGAPNHLKKHSKAADKAQALASQEGSEAEGATPAVPSGAKRSRSYDGTPTPSMRLFMPSANQLYVFLKNLALFFYTTNIALHLIENPYLVQACPALGVTLPSRWKLATTMLDEAHAETVVEKECAAGEGLACIASDGWRSRVALGGTPLIKFKTV